MTEAPPGSTYRKLHYNTALR